MKIFATLYEAKSNTGNTRGWNLTEVKRRTVHMSLSQQKQTLDCTASGLAKVMWVVCSVNTQNIVYRKQRNVYMYLNTSEKKSDLWQRTQRTQDVRIQYLNLESVMSPYRDSTPRRTDWLPVVRWLWLAVWSFNASQLRNPQSSCNFLPIWATVGFWNRTMLCGVDIVSSYSSTVKQATI